MSLVNPRVKFHTWAACHISCFYHQTDPNQKVSVMPYFLYLFLGGGVNKHFNEKITENRRVSVLLFYLALHFQWKHMGCTNFRNEPLGTQEWTHLLRYGPLGQKVWFQFARFAMKTVMEYNYRRVSYDRSCPVADHSICGASPKPRGWRHAVFLFYF